MDVSSLEALVQDLFSAGLAPSSQRNYQSGTRRYLKFCTDTLINDPFPTTEPTLTLFVAWLHAQNLSSGTVKNYLAAVRHSQISLGLGDPQMGSMPRLEYVVRGMKRKAQTVKQPRLPVTPMILRSLRQSWQCESNQRNMAMLWAAVTMCFFGFLRSGEV